jgi:muconolactone D-isomerase
VVCLRAPGLEIDGLPELQPLPHDQPRQITGSQAYVEVGTGEVSDRIVSVFDVADNEALHDVLWALPLLPHMKIEALPLAQHPSAI